MQKIDRLLKIILTLQNSKKKIITAKELSEKLEVDIRTIYRYIQALDYAGVPIESTPGRGYRLEEGYHLPPVMLTEKEAVALLIGSEFVIKKVDSSYKKDASSAFLKIKSILKKETLEYVNKIGEFTVVMDDKFTDKNLIAKIQNAIAETKIIKLSYYSLKDEITQRAIEPMGLIYYNENWRIIAFCKLRNAFREFRLNRINNIRYTNNKFVKRKFSLNDFVGEFYNIHNPIELKVLFDKKSARIVKEKYSRGLTSEKDVKNGVEMTFLIDEKSVDITVNWILAFHKGAKIISPQDFKDRLQKKVADILKLY
jgi:predicted DNA-binding transcriptional regulator YafY